MYTGSKQRNNQTVFAGVAAAAVSVVVWGAFCLIWLWSASCSNLNFHPTHDCHNSSGWLLLSRCVLLSPNTCHFIWNILLYRIPQRGSTALIHQSNFSHLLAETGKCVHVCLISLQYGHSSVWLELWLVEIIMHYFSNWSLFKTVYYFWMGW